MKSPAEVIRGSIRFDHDLTGNTDRILDALTAEGYVIARRGSTLPETTRLYGSKVVETRG